MSYVLDLRVKKSPRFGRHLVLRLSVPELKRRLNWMLVVMMLMTIAAPIFDAFWTGARYDLNASQALLPAASTRLAGKLTLDEKLQLYQFNKDGRSAKDQNGASIGSGDSQLYSADLPVGSGKPVTIYDNVNQLQLSFAPNFKTLDGKSHDNRVVYPLESGQPQLVYTLASSGVKEDITLRSPGADSMSFGYSLNLPNNLEARLLPSGGVGIYSADPSLYGNISFGSDADRQAVDRARTNSAKTYLAFAIPAPVIKQGGRKAGHPAARFTLDGNTLTLKAASLRTASYPLSIDPSFMVTSAGDWGKGNDEGDLDYDNVNGQLKRGGLTGGTLGSWNPATASLPSVMRSFGSAYYNGNIYAIGGATNGGTSTAYGTVTSTGNVTSASSGSSLVESRTGTRSVAYNGYIYAFEGQTVGAPSTVWNTYERAKINSSDASIGAWTEDTGNPLPTARSGPLAAVYNGYVYVYGGCASYVTVVCATAVKTVDYAPIKADGSLGAWTTSPNQLANNHFINNGGVAYNGYLYAISGNGTTSVEYAKLNSDGSTGTWQTTVALPSARRNTSAVFYKGYVYVIGGDSGSGPLATSYYAAVNADGTLGAWDTTQVIPTALNSAGTVADSNGHIIFYGGNDGSSNYSQIIYAAVDPAGTTGTGLTATSLNTARWAHGTAVSKGYIYVAGGCTSTSGACASSISSVEFAKINADGTLGSWTNATNSMNNARAGTSLVADQGVLYAVAGCNLFVSGLCTTALPTIETTTTNDSTGQPASWSIATNSLATGRFSPEAVIYNGRLYVVGGQNSGGTSQSSVEIATVNAGPPGTFSQSTPTNFTARSQFALGAYNGRIYAAGGRDNSGGAIDSSSYITINTDGTLASSWTTGPSLQTNTGKGTSGFVDKGYFYTLGKSTGAQIQYSLINSDGSLAGFSQTNSMAAGAGYGHAVAANGYYYYPAGCTSNLCDADTNTTKYGLINNGGSGGVAAWNTANTTFIASRYGHMTTVSNGYIYVINGCNSQVSGKCSNILTNGQYAAINSDGNLSNWSTLTTSPTTARADGAIASYNGYLYLLGGCITVNTILGGCTATTASVEFAKPAANGDITSSWTTTTAGSNSTLSPAAVAYKGYLYMSGGLAGASLSATMEYARLNGSTGDLVAGGTSCGGATVWCATTSLSVARNGHALAAYNGYMYVVGGCNNGSCGTNELSSVESAVIAGDGSLGSWVTTASMQNKRSTFALYAHDGYLCAAAGAYNGAGLASVECAQLLAGGTVGNWNSTVSLAATQNDSKGAVYNGVFYFIAGQNSSGAPVATSYYAALQATPRSGHYSRFLDCEADCTPTKLLTRGTAGGADSVVTNSYSCATNSSPTFGSTTTSTLTLGNLLTIPYQIKRYCWVGYTLDDSLSAVFPDTNQTSLSNFNLYYHPASSRRLRGGKTFTGNAQQSLDASP